MKDTLRIRFRIDFNSLCSIGPGKIQLLEMIAKSGSLSQAAREMGMSYRRAWMLMDSMNNSFDAPVVSASTGGSGGGGATLTEFGQQLLNAYRQLDEKLADIAIGQMQDILRHARHGLRKASKKVPSATRLTLARSGRPREKVKSSRRQSS